MKGLIGFGSSRIDLLSMTRSALVSIPAGGPLLPFVELPAAAPDFT